MAPAVDWFVEGLKRREVDWIATLCGHGLDPFFHAARRAGLLLVDTRNEQTAAYLAETYGRLTRRPGVCAVSSGVAHVNALSGVANAWFDGTPMLLISGAGALATAGLGHFQDMDQVALASPLTRYARLLDCPERVIEILDHAFAAAAGPPPGPVHLTFPMDVQRAEVRAEDLTTAVAVATIAPNEDPGQAARLLAKSARPLIVAGSGVFYAGAGAAMLDFAERYAIPVVAPIWDRGAIDRVSPVFLGVVGAASGGPRLLADADCILMAGAVPDYRVGFLRPGAVRGDAEVAYLERAWQPLADAYESIGAREHRDWLAEAARRRGEFVRCVRARALEQQAGEGLHAVHIIDALRSIVDERTCLLIDGGSIGQWAHHLLCDRYPGRWLTCGRSGVVGWGVGGAMGARLACPDDPVILLSGDGAFTFNVADLESAVRQRLGFVAIVADDQGWGITRTGHLKQFGEPIASALGPVAFDRLAEALGARGTAVSRVEEIEPALRRAIAEPGVTVIHVPIVGGNPA